MKIVYAVNSAGVYLRDVTLDESDLSPLEQDVFLIPSNCLEISPHPIPDGDTAVFSNGKWMYVTPEPEPEVVPEPPPEPFKPRSVTMRQARLALLQAGYYSSVQTAINAIEDPVQKQASQIEWEYAATVDRNSSFTQGMATALGLSEQDMDNLFMLAWSL